MIELLVNIKLSVIKIINKSGGGLMGWKVNIKLSVIKIQNRLLIINNWKVNIKLSVIKINIC